MAHAQIDASSFDFATHYSKVDGLSSDFVHDMTEDEYGFLWLATGDGVTLFDGTNFTNYRHYYEQNEANDLGFIYAIIPERANDRIWICGGNGIFFTSKNEIRFQRVNELVPALLPKLGRTVALLIDEDNILWSSIPDIGLLKIDLNSKVFEHFSFAGKQNLIDPDINTITCIGQDPVNSDILWLTSAPGIIRFNKVTNEFKVIKTNDTVTNYKDHFRFMHIDNKALYLGGWTKGFLVFDIESEQFMQPLKKKYPNTHLSIQDFYVIDSNLWITSPDGLVQYNLESSSIGDVYENIGDSVSGISLIDSKGRIWYNNENGLNKYGQNNLTHSFIDLTDIIDEQSVWAVQNIFQKNNSIYIANIERLDLIKVNLENHFVDKISIVPSNTIDSSAYTIRDAILLNNGKYLILTRQKILEFDPITEKVNDLSFQVQIPDLSARSIIQDRDENVWIGTSNGSLFKMNIENEALTDYTSKLNKIDSNITSWTKELYLDSKDRLWVSKRPAVCIIDLNDMSISCNIPSQEQNLESISSVSSFHEDDNELMWIAKYSDGIEIFNMDNPPYNPLNKVNGFFSDIHPYNDTLLWTTGNGLGILNKNTLKNKKLKMYSSDDKMKAIGAIYETESQEPLIVCKNGILIIHKPNQKLDQTLPHAYITSIESNGIVLFKGNSLSNKKMTLKSDIDHLKVNISSLGYQLQNQVAYQYKLKNTWIDNGENEEINITNLSHGQYTLKLKACNDFGMCYESPTEYNFVIPPPWYKSWWAYLLYAFAVFTPLAFIYRFNLKRKMAVAEKNKALEIDALKSKMYANISHEFRTPLTVILGMVNVLRSTTNDRKEEKNKSLDMIQRNGENLLVMVNEMLDLAKVESGNMQLNLIQSDIIPFIKYLSESFQSLAENKEIKLTVYSEIDKLEMDFDINKFGTIISNLLSNSIKFSSEGDKIIVHLSLSQIKGKDFLVIKIKDTGSGLSKEEIKQIFDRFYQAKNASTNQGTGLGLSLVKEFVELMNGQIEVESSKELGSNFIIKIPITNKAIQTVDVQMTSRVNSNSQETPPTFSSSDENAEQSEFPLVLIIEDNEDVAHYLNTTLKSKYKILHAKNGIVGVEMALETIPDVVISDVMMPGKDGFQVCQELKTNELTEHIPIIMLTAKATDIDRVVGLSRGADAYLSKPFNEAELFTRLDQLIALRQKLLSKIDSGEVGKILKKRLEDPETKFLQKAIKIIHNNMAVHSFGSALLAHKLQVSESQVYRKLKAITGKSTALFIRSIRLIKGKEMMQSSDKTISEISYEVGFNDPSWFSRAFKEEFGFSPREMRK